MEVELFSPGYVEKYRQALDSIPPLERWTDDGTLHVKRAFRGLTLEQAVRYLEHLGGERVGDRTVEADEWRAELATGTVPVGPSYRLTEVVIEWKGEEAILDPVILRFRVKAFRAPG